MTVAIHPPSPQRGSDGRSRVASGAAEIAGSVLVTVLLGLVSFVRGRTYPIEGR